LRRCLLNLHKVFSKVIEGRSRRGWRDALGAGRKGAAWFKQAEAALFLR
jgi:hypothetical protein